jgi:hypothetical protein
MHSEKTKEKLIDELFVSANSQYLRMFLLIFILPFYVIGPVLCFIYPKLVRQSTSIEGLLACLLLSVTFTVIYWILVLFRFFKNSKVKKYYGRNSECVIRAYMKADNISLVLEIDDKKIEISKYFLKESPEEYIRVLNM